MRHLESTHIFVKGMNDYLLTLLFSRQLSLLLNDQLCGGAAVRSWALGFVYSLRANREERCLLSVLCNLFAINEANGRVEYSIKVRERRTFDTCDLNTEDGWR